MYFISSESAHKLETFCAEIQDSLGKFCTILQAGQLRRHRFTIEFLIRF